MSTIDLERLIVKQTYLIPIESSKLKNAILNELRKSYPEIDGIYSWNLAEEHRLSFVFILIKNILTYLTPYAEWS